MNLCATGQEEWAKTTVSSRNKPCCYSRRRWRSRSGRRRPRSGRWRPKSGRRRTKSGRRRTKSGRRRTKSGRRRTSCSTPSTSRSTNSSVIRLLTPVHHDVEVLEVCAPDFTTKHELCLGVIHDEPIARCKPSKTLCPLI